MLRRGGGSEKRSTRKTPAKKPSQSEAIVKARQTKDSLMKDLRLIFKEQDLEKWLDAPNDQLGGKKPNEVLGTPEQGYLVDMVEAVKYGLPT
ncbi:MAG TPA: MbcA/ParS/Xre antitoxin family protein [Pirellulales bacterium]|jgi:uncharacterized protein (DUF2384 family)|nr:MbcA/ParS/Xre antitoxin family protein [Pirellulales bacterium]